MKAVRIAIYSYGALAPQEGGELIRDGLAVAHAYQNALVKSARRYREMEEATVRSSCEMDLVGAAERARWWVNQWIALARKMRSDGRAQQRGASPLAVRIDRARYRERQAHERLWTAERSARKIHEVAEALRALREAHQAAHRLLRSEHGSPGQWGTRGMVDLAVDDALEKVRKRRYGLDGKPADPSVRPQLHNERDGGRVGVQLIGGLSVAEACACTDSRLRIEILDAPTNHAPGSRRAGAKRALIWMRLDSDGREPKWTKLRTVLHRPLPPAGQIQRAWIVVRPIGRVLDYQVQLTVREEVTYADMPASPSTVVLNRGWRRLEDGGVRVGYALGSDGIGREIRVLPEVESAIKHADSIRSIRAQSFQAMVSRVVLFATTDAAPAALRRAVAGALRWSSIDHLHALASRWTGTPEGPEGELVEALRGWGQHDYEHLAPWEACEREKAVRRRRDDPSGYRAIAAQLARQYDRIVISDMDVTELARQADPKDDSRGAGSAQQRQRSMAAPGELLLALKNAFGRRGPGRIVDESGRLKTRTCPACGVVDEGDATIYRASVDVACPTCGVKRDQDESHCRLLMVRVSSGAVAWPQAAPLAPSVGGEGSNEQATGGRFQRRRSRRQAQKPATPAENG